MSNAEPVYNVEFKSKKLSIIDRYGEIHDYIKVPELKKTHCDMNFFRSGESRLSMYSNSDFFENMLDSQVRKLFDLDGNRLLRLDKLPECVKATPIGNGYLCKVEIAVPA